LPVLLYDILAVKSEQWIC